MRVSHIEHCGLEEARDTCAALATGDLGFLHSFTTGSTLDGPGVRVVAWATSLEEARSRYEDQQGDV